jgi:hypothetical protein
LPSGFAALAEALSFAALSSPAREARPLPVTAFPPDFDAPAEGVFACVLFAIFILYPYYID